MKALDNGFHEAVGIVHDLDDSIARLCAGLDYGVIWRGQSASATLDLLGIDPGWPAQEALIGDPGQGRGHIRLFAFPDRVCGVMRDGAQPWDTGGLFDINIRSLGAIEPIHAAMTRNGFCAFGPITAWDFGAVSVKQVVSRDADGLAIALMQRIAPSLVGFEQVVGPVSYVFNSTQVVADFDRARTLYVDALGWQPVQESRWVHDDGRNCMGLPPDVARTRELRAGIYQSKGRFEGSVEILSYGGEALDFGHAGPPDRGWAALRLPMTDPDAFLRRAAKAGCVVMPPRRIVMQPYGAVEAGVAVTPWGVRLEAFTLS